MKSIITLLLVILAADVEAKDSRHLRSKASKSRKASYSYSMSMSKSGKGSKSASYSYSMSMSKSGKGSKSSSKSGKSLKGYGYSMSFPPDFCYDLSFAVCVVYIVNVDGKFQQQSRSGDPLSQDFDSEALAVDDVTNSRSYVPAADESQQKDYSGCYKGSGTLVNKPVYFPDQADCGNISFN